MVGLAADTSSGVPKGMGMSSGVENVCYEHSDTSLTHQVEDGSWGCAATLDGPEVAWPAFWRPGGVPEDVGPLLSEHCTWQHALRLDCR